MKAKKILIVEDNKDLNELYDIVFTKHGYSIKIAENGKKALETVVEFEPDLVLLDIMMPEMDGFEFLEKFFDEIQDIQIKKKMVIVINSNLSQEQDIKKSFDLGANYYLKKSDFTPFSLVNKVAEILKKEGDDFNQLP